MVAAAAVRILAASNAAKRLTAAARLHCNYQKEMKRSHFAK